MAEERRIFLGPDEKLSTYTDIKELDKVFDMYNIVIRDNVQIGDNVKINSDVVIHNGVSIHDNVRIGEYVTINPHCKICHKASIGNHCNIREGVAILDYARIGNGITIDDSVAVPENSIISEKVGGYICKVVHIEHAYDYSVDIIMTSTNDYIRLGCYTMTPQEWKKNFWNNTEAYPFGSVATKARLSTLNMCLSYLGIRCLTTKTLQNIKKVEI